MINQDRLKEALKYDRLTGDFIWLQDEKFSRTKAGSVAGYLNHGGYIVIGIDGRHYYAHKLAFLHMEGYMPENVDHIDHIASNNKWGNLREVEHIDNMRNRSLQSNNKSGVCGVYWCKKRGKWIAKIKVSQRVVQLGGHRDINAAILTRKVAEFAYGFHPNHGKLTGRVL